MTTTPERGVSSEAPRYCSEGCHRTVHCKGLCQPCYRRYQRNGHTAPLTAEERKRPGPKPVKFTDHRKLDGAEKLRRASARAAKRAARTYCGNGHELNERNTYFAKNGDRVCRICQRNWQQRYHGRPVSGDAPLGVRNGLKTHCPQGHPYQVFGAHKGETDRSRRCRACRRQQRLLQEYGLTPEQWDAMVVAQLGRCAICDEHALGDLHVDHDHETGEVRALLCSNCNNGVGRFEEDIPRLQLAIEYLQHFRKTRLPVAS